MVTPVVDALVKAGVEAYVLKSNPDMSIPPAKMPPALGAALASIPIVGTIADNTEYATADAVWTITGAGTAVGLEVDGTNDQRLNVPRLVDDPILRSWIFRASVDGTAYDETRYIVGGQQDTSAHSEQRFKLAAAVAYAVRLHFEETSDVRYFSVYGKGDAAPTNSLLTLHAGY